MTTAVSLPMVPARWRATGTALLAVLVVAFVLFRDTALSMVEIWARSDTFMHAFLVPPVVLWLLWRDRHRILAQAPKPVPWMLVPLAVLVAVWLAGELLMANALTQFAFTALVVLSVPAVAGLAVTRAMLFPLLFLFFAVPVGEFMLPVLMMSTADFTVWALRLSGVPTYREGLQIMIPSGNWSVVEACSGVRYLIASAMVGTLFAYLNFNGLRKRLAFVAVALVVPVFANWVRAYMIVMLGHLSGNRLAVGVDHLIYGWVFFGIVMLVMFLVGARWSDPVVPRDTGTSAGSAAASSGPVRPWPTALVYLAVLVLPHLALSTVAAASATDGAARLAAVNVPGWQRQAGDPAQRPAYQSPSEEWQAGFERGGQRVELYIAHYRHQDRVHKLVSSQNVIVGSDHARWVVGGVGRRVAVEAAGAQGPVRVEATRLRTRPQEALAAERHAWRVFRVNGQWTASEAEARIQVALQRLHGRGDDAAAVVVSSESEAALAAFLKDALGPLQRQLDTGVRP